MPIAIIVLDQANKELISIANIIKKDLEFTDQFAPSVKKYPANMPKKELRKAIKELAYTDTPLALCINTQSSKSIDWHLYDTMQCSQLSAQRYRKKGKALHRWAHNIADETRKTLTGHNGLFSSRIAFCKNAKNEDSKTIRKIYVADCDGSNPELIIDSCGITLAPRWHPKKAKIYYSENTTTGMQLKEMGKNISPFENGINMLVNFDEDGKNYAFCASRGNGNCQIYLNKDGKIKPCTKNPGNNDSPIFIDHERLCFCSDFQTGSPQIYIGNLTTGHLQRITPGGYCTSPSYCRITNQIVYHKMICGIMQIMIYDCATKTHTQLTHNGGNKHEASWSPDGMFLAFSHECSRENSRIAILNISTKKTKYVTNAHEYCSYPNWSPSY